jgi:hypothetical protein
MVVVTTMLTLHSHRAIVLNKLSDDRVVGVLEVGIQELTNVIYRTLEASTIAL